MLAYREMPIYLADQSFARMPTHAMRLHEWAPGEGSQSKRGNHGSWFAPACVGLTGEGYCFFAGRASVVGEVTKPSVRV
jgi:hypothetical protein